MRKESKHTLKSSDHKRSEQEKMKGAEELQNIQKKINKMAISTYLSIII